MFISGKEMSTSSMVHYSPSWVTFSPPATQNASVDGRSCTKRRATAAAVVYIDYITIEKKDNLHLFNVCGTSTLLKSVAS